MNTQKPFFGRKHLSNFKGRHSKLLEEMKDEQMNAQWAELKFSKKTSIKQKVDREHLHVRPHPTFSNRKSNFSISVEN